MQPFSYKSVKLSVQHLVQHLATKEELKGEWILDQVNATVALCLLEVKWYCPYSMLCSLQVGKKINECKVFYVNSTLGSWSYITYGQKSVIPHFLPVLEMDGGHWGVLFCLPMDLHYRVDTFNPPKYGTNHKLLHPENSNRLCVCSCPVLLTHTHRRSG